MVFILQFVNVLYHTGWSAGIKKFLHPWDKFYLILLMHCGFSLLIFLLRIILPLFIIDVLCLVAQSCPTLCDPMDCSPPGSSVHGDFPGKNTGVGLYAFLQGIFPTQGWNPGLPHCKWIFYYLSHQGSPRILEWVAYPFSRGFSQPRNRIWRRQWQPTPVLLPGKSHEWRSRVGYSP